MHKDNFYKDNSFYDEFDKERYEGSRRRDYRTRFQRDRDRIIHSSAFRRLQAKTQVFFPGEYDFYRNRLTHSLEVAQIGTSICTHLYYKNTEEKVLPNGCYIDPNLVEGICLAHDMGHPPFGHAGERILHRYMKNHGGFEGNAQTLRIIMETIGSDKDVRSGMNPTRAFMDGVMKYKKIYNDSTGLTNHFLYVEQRECRDYIFGGKPLPSEEEEDINNFRSIECQIMDWADEIAYTLGDVADGIKAGFITISKLDRFAQNKELKGDDANSIEKLQTAMYERTVRQLVARKIGYFITSTSLKERKNFLSELSKRYRYELQVKSDARREANLYQKLSKSLIFKTPSIQQLDRKGERIISGLFEELRNVYVGTDKPKHGFLPTEVERAINGLSTKKDKVRKICDYIAGMTDGFAIRMYRRFFDPQFGSITDLIEMG